MSALGPAWSQELAKLVYARLDVLDQVAAGVVKHVDVDRVRAEMAEQVATWRRLLQQHEPVDGGRCPECSGWLLHRRWPCGVWRTAHQSLVAHPIDPRVVVDGPRAAAPGWEPDPSLSRPLGARIPIPSPRKTPADPDPRVSRTAASRDSLRGAVVRGRAPRHARAES